jgi:Universal stress protein family
MIPIGQASSTASEPGEPGEPGSSQSPARQGSGCRRVAVIVDGSTESAPALRQAAAQARQRNATLDVICLVPMEADARAVTMARVRLGELSRRACPYGVGAPVRLRVEHGGLDTVLPAIRAEVELLVPGPGMVADQAIS